MTIWDYKVDQGIHLGGKAKAEDLQKYLNKQGEEQWELIAFLAGNPNEGREDLWVFKRPMPVKKVTR
jgi:hypothetical protein